MNSLISASLVHGLVSLALDPSRDIFKESEMSGQGMDSPSVLNSLSKMTLLFLGEKGDLQENESLYQRAATKR